MAEHTPDDELLDIGPDRRKFIKRVAAVTAFAAPMIASYDLESLHSSVASAIATNSTNSARF